MASIVVYCGSSTGSDPAHARAAEELGAELVRHGHELIYGGGHVGLMGIVADAVLAAGGRATGVITEQLRDLEVAHTGLTALEVEATMHARKARMAALADAAIVLPGGFGTYEEAFELLTWNQLGIVSAPVVFVDVGGFYAPLLAFVDRAVEAGFVRPDHGALARRATTAAEAVEAASAPADEYVPKWVGGAPGAT